MRGILVALIVFGCVPIALVRPYVGVLVWCWIGFMNPHRLAYGFAYNFPFAAVIGGATLIGLVFVREPKRLPNNPLVWVWILFALWLCVAMLFAWYPDPALVKWSRTMKIMLFALVTVMLMARRDRLHWLVWITVLSLDFYGVKGGIFTMTHSLGGRELVYGPPGSFIEENNALALALIMTLPLIRYLYIVAESKWTKWGLLAAMLLTVASIVGSYSRGALLGGAAMGMYLWLKSEHKFRIGVALLIVGSLLVAFVPHNWVKRMDTISNYQTDESAQGRINAWWTAFHVANARPLVGGGFNALQQKETFARYAPEPNNVHDAHSIYFEVLGESGYVGLALFLAFGWLALRTGKWIIRNTRDHPDLHWANRLAAMIQVSLIGYAVGGAFLGLAFFDLYYHLVALLVITRVLVEQALQEQAAVPVGEMATANGALPDAYPSLRDNA